jgi:hypothetical protein
MGALFSHSQESGARDSLKRAAPRIEFGVCLIAWTSRLVSHNKLKILYKRMFVLVYRLYNLDCSWDYIIQIIQPRLLKLGLFFLYI